ncbi:hypothetical protein [Anaerotignum sp.]|uniref:hypothetical protein n=1 Tax=Anaerotignum sp. TaxID=2039241 RepID=UPI002715182C|nr:hypothetical protein [Anaerotignum sp.]
MNTTFTGLLLNLQKQYNKVNELQDVTKQMAECLQRNDLYSFRLLMKMRTDVMLELDDIDFAREDLLHSLPENEQKIARGVMAKEVEENVLISSDLQRVHDIYKKIKRNLQTTIQLDKAINLKIGGNNSFYKNNR